MGISTADLLAQFQRARVLWGSTIDSIEQAHDLPLRLLYAIGSRETNLDPYWAEHVGDGGFAYGLCQIDRRWHHIPPNWAGNIDWQFRKAAELIVDWHSHCGSWQSACSAYNAGSCDPNFEYGVDVMDRLSRLQSFDSSGDCAQVVLREGDRGLCVGALQRLLGIEDDGIFGPRTAEAVAVFQERTQIAVDGMVGPQTWGALQEASCRTKVLRLSDSGDCVRRLQLMIGVPDDSEFGLITRDAIMDFQHNAGLVVDGVVGPETWAALARTRSLLPRG